MVDEQPEIEGKPQLLVKMLCVLKIFKEVKGEDELRDLEVSSNDTELDFSSKFCFDENDPLDSQFTAEYSCSNKMEARRRRRLERQCFDLMWAVLAFGGREVTKGLLLNLIHVLLTLEETPVETKAKVVQEAARVSGIESSLDLNALLKSFSALARNARRYLPNFAKQFKDSQSSTEEKEISECTFYPAISNRSRKLDSARKEKSEARAKALQQKSQSPPRHNALYENYKEVQKNLEKLSKERREEENKKLPFRPKVSKHAEKYKEDKERRVSLA